jgi:hypothetical protein
VSFSVKTKTKNKRINKRSDVRFVVFLEGGGGSKFSLTLHVIDFYLTLMTFNLKITLNISDNRKSEILLSSANNFDLETTLRCCAGRVFCIPTIDGRT